MKHVLISLLTGSTLLLTAVVSARQWNVPTVEPVNGFTRGADPEWSKNHTDKETKRDPNHRAYHKEKIQAHNQWHQNWQLKKGTQEYIDAHRAFHRLRNLEHRQHHLKQMGLMPWIKKPEEEYQEPSIILNLQQVMTEQGTEVVQQRVFHGIRPSRRILEMLHAKWQASISLKRAKPQS